MGRGGGRVYHRSNVINISPFALTASGAYGQVFLASKSGSNYAIKKFSQGDPSYDRELRLLKHFNHPNVISLVDAFASAKASFVVLPHVATDLGRLIASRQPLNLKQTKYLAWQTLLGLLHVHSAGVAHRDLKPGNILVTAAGAVSICDFGMSKSLAGGADATEYVVTRFYRAPELLLGAGYGKQVDIWSYGCILGELFTRDALFKGQNYVEQLRSILRLVGASIESVAGWEEGGIRNFLGTCPESDVGCIVPGMDEGGKALLAACLCLNPERRSGAEVRRTTSERGDERSESQRRSCSCSEVPTEVITQHVRSSLLMQHRERVI